ncbi:ABC transporter ATP-binding protein [Clostridium sp.]|jgi:putative ABC transport system ATP-binding protein|uniref:ABC transporter ATP-binding protein n=1 Tax=Clostridium sp. TaxID=1506 RepID=UPI002FDDEA51
MDIIKLQDINKSYGNKKVLVDLSLSISKGEFVAITGDSGKGKSTLLNIIGLLENIDSGSLLIDGEENIKINSAKAMKVIREKISYLFQNFALVDEDTVNYNLNLALKYIKISKNEKKERIKNALIGVGLEGYGKRKIYELSGGEQQRVSIARTMLKPSKIVLADEPTGSLDEGNAKVVLELLRSLNKNGKTIVIVTHDKKLSTQCDRIINL